MDAYQQPYSQGLVPTIQRMQPMQQYQPMQQMGVADGPNAGQQAYLAALQEQLKASQQSTADSVKGYQETVQQKLEADAAKKKDDGGGFWGALGGIIAKAAPVALALI